MNFVFVCFSEFSPETTIIRSMMYKLLFSDSVNGFWYRLINRFSGIWISVPETSFGYQFLVMISETVLGNGSRKRFRVTNSGTGFG